MLDVILCVLEYVGVGVLGVAALAACWEWSKWTL